MALSTAAVYAWYGGVRKAIVAFKGPWRRGDVLRRTEPRANQLSIASRETRVLDVAAETSG